MLHSVWLRSCLDAMASVKSVSLPLVCDSTSRYRSTGCFLTDKKCSYMQGTWGTDIKGDIVVRSYYRSELVERDIVAAACFARIKECAFEESVPIYHDFNIVGVGWTAMTMLTTNTGEPIALLRCDRLLTRSPLTSQLREVIRIFCFEEHLLSAAKNHGSKRRTKKLNETLEQESVAHPRARVVANERCRYHF